MYKRATVSGFSNPSVRTAGTLPPLVNALKRGGNICEHTLPMFSVPIPSPLVCVPMHSNKPSGNCCGDPGNIPSAFTVGEDLGQP